MSTARNLGIVALALGVAAPFAGDPQRPAQTTIDIDELAGVVMREEDHVSAIELAGWIRGRRPGLRVLDVRSLAEYQEYAIPGAEHLPIADIVRSRFSDDEVLVLYSQGGAHAAQAWVFLRALGLRQVYFLRGGLQEWMEDLMHPLLAADASAETVKRFEATAELSRYFGGAPGIGDAQAKRTASAHDGDAATSVARARRRGC
jgi:rhodanese-related sulfurtransferase